MGSFSVTFVSIQEFLQVVLVFEFSSVKVTVQKAFSTFPFATPKALTGNAVVPGRFVGCYNGCRK